MKYVLDVSVAVAALRKVEPFHAQSLRRCLPLFAGDDDAVVPAIFEVEFASALVRTGVAIATINRFLVTHLSSRRIVTIGPRAAGKVRAVVELTRLRAADALYVWVAMRENLPIVTLDREVLARARLVGVVAEMP